MINDIHLALFSVGGNTVFLFVSKLVLFFVSEGDETDGDGSKNQKKIINNSLSKPTLTTLPKRNF